MWRRETRRVYHVARTDVLVRLRDRKLLVFLAVVAYVGYLVNSGQFGLFYTVDGGPSVNAALTSAAVGLNAGIAGSFVTLFAAFYVFRGTLARDERYGHGPVVASSPTPTPTFLLGKLGGHAAIGLVTAVVLAAAAVVNHAVHGVGATDPLTIAWPVFVMVPPLAVLIGGVAVLFETIDPLSGTLGRIGYFLLAVAAVSAQLGRPEDAPPSALSSQLRAVDFLGTTLAYELTFQSIQTAVPGFDGGFASFGTGGDVTNTFQYRGRPWPAWFFFQRLGAATVGVGLTLAAWVPFDRFRDTTPGPLGRLGRVVPAVSPTTSVSDDSSGDDHRETDRPTVETLSLTPVEDRDAGGIGRLVAAELRRLLRGHPWWWYAGAAVITLAPVVVTLTGGTAGRTALPIAAVWPVFVWSRLGSQTARAGVSEQLRASRHPVGQLLAEWVAGCLIAVGVAGGALIAFSTTAGIDALISLAGVVVFPPSFALTAGLWTASPRLFEAVYLGVWYLGPLNGGYPADFVGVTDRALTLFVPVAFAIVGMLGVVVAARRRRVYS